MTEGPESPSNAPASSGRKFHLQALIGAGAFGEVYLAEQDSGAGFRRPVALKVLHSELQGMAEAGRRMRDEARILARLSHRSIVTVLDLVRLGDRWAVVMDYVPGADLEMVIEALKHQNRPFPIPAALEIAAAVLDALHAAYHADDGTGRSLKVVHRDIKPSNIRITRDGEVKVLDFGVASVNLDTREAQTKGTGWMGTERYMSPERILCEGDEPAGDVYAVMASLVEALLLRPLGRTPVLPERHAPFLKKALDEVRPLLNGSPEVQDRLIHLLSKGLHAYPSERPTAQALSDGLVEIARKMDGDGFRNFARDFVPQVDQILGRQTKPASGILTEQSGGGTTLMPQGTAPTANPATADYQSGGFRESPSAMSPGGRSPGGVSPGGRTQSRSQVTAADGQPVPEFFERDFPPEAGDQRGLPVALLAGVGLILGGLVLVVTILVVVVGLQQVNGNQAQTPAPAPVPVAVPEPAPAPAPAPVPTASPEPVPVVPEPEPEPAPAPGPKPRPDVAVPKPAAPDPAPVTAPRGPPVSRALIVVPDASSVEVTCGGVSASGSSSARIKNFPGGACLISAVYLGKTIKASVMIDKPAELNCTPSDGGLKCP